MKQTRYTKADLEDFEHLLLIKKRRTNEQIEEYSTQIQEISENGKDENSIENTGYDTQLSYLMDTRDRALVHLRHIEAALSRIAKGTYGICSVTGNLIDKNRLRAVPTTTKSIIAKQQKK